MNMARVNTCILLITLLPAVALLWGKESRAAAKRGAGVAGAHAVAIAHPAQEGSAPARRELVAVPDAAGEPQEYSMDVDSVICGDGTCKTITVRIVWDAIGDYKRYELPEGGHLTKKGNKPFSAADNARLHSLLADPNSALKNLRPKQIAVPGQTILGVDAVSGATPATIRKAVVPGAVYTCYTLWHWANGPACDAVRRITAETCSDGWLRRCLDNDSERFAIFAMDQLAARRIHDSAALKVIVRRADEGSGRAVKACLRYLERIAAGGKPDIHFSTVAQLFATADNHTRILYITSLSKASQAPPAGYWDQLSRWLPRLDMYYPMHMLLKLMEERNPRSAEVTKQMMAVLGNENFLIARRAFQFLEGQTLTPEQQKQVSAFREKNADRL